MQQNMKAPFGHGGTVWSPTRVVARRRRLLERPSGRVRFPHQSDAAAGANERSLAAQGPATQQIQRALTDQHLEIQSRLRSSRPYCGVAGARDCGASGRRSNVVNDEGVGSHHSGGAEREQLGGRSRLIPAVLNDFWLVDDGPSWSVWAAGWGTASARAQPMPAGTFASMGMAADCGAAEVAGPKRTAQLPARALNTQSTATMATSDRHREGIPASRTITMAQLYQW